VYLNTVTLGTAMSAPADADVGLIPNDEG